MHLEDEMTRSIVAAPEGVSLETNGEMTEHLGSSLDVLRVKYMLFDAAGRTSWKARPMISLFLGVPDPATSEELPRLFNSGYVCPSMFTMPALVTEFAVVVFKSHACIIRLRPRHVPNAHVPRSP